MKKISGTSRLVVAALLLTATLLAACGDSPTAVPATTAPAATTAAATTAAPAATTAAATTVAATTAAPSTAAATTAAATTVATTAAATTVAATTAATSATTAAGASGTPCATCPASYSTITLPQGLADAAQKGIPANVSNFSIEAFGADDSIDKVATDLDASITARGYAFALPGATKPIKVGNYYTAAYSKAGGPDALVQVVDVANLAEFLKTTGADDASQQTFTQAVGSKKTVVFLFGGTGLLTASLGSSGTPTSAASGTTAAATTAATGTGTTADVPTYPGAVLVTLPEALQTQFASSLGSSIKNGKLEAYKVTDTDTQVKDYFTKQFTTNGWTDSSSLFPASSTAQLTALGIGLVGPYVSAPKIALVMIMPGSLFAGQAGVAATDLVYMVISGTAA